MPDTPRLTLSHRLVPLNGTRPDAPTGPGAPRRGHGFGTAPVFLAAISTILGAILFLRFGYAVGHTGLLGAIAIVLIGHAITIPTGLAVAEIATNLKVEGGGEYYIISRSFGLKIGAAIGVALYLSQAISVAFYMLAFAEAFRPLFPPFEQLTGIPADIRIVGIPATLLLVALMLRKGADLGVRALWVVTVVLALAIALFLLGRPLAAPPELDLLARVADRDNFFFVFAIVFPAFTGMTAGVGLSGDLANPRRSIPLGTIAATLTGMLVYLLVVFKLAASATPEQLASDQFIMGRIALWEPIIYLGLAAATLSSAIGSILVAPRTMQALASDRAFGSEPINRFLSAGKGTANEPVNATLVTSMFALVFVALGSVDFVAQIISMFFMVTYGSLCAISFLQHFSGNPAYRPTFRTKWYFSAVGAAACLVMMYAMQPLYALLSMVVMTLVYLSVRRVLADERDLTTLFQGVLAQIIRNLQLILQKKQESLDAADWRPSFIAISAGSFKRLGAFDLLRWISQHQGFGSYYHFMEGHLSREAHLESGRLQQQLVEQSRASRAGTWVDTIISPSFRTAVAQLVQMPGVAGMENNSILFDYSREDGERARGEIADGSRFAAMAGFNVCVLRSAKRHFGYRRSIHIWLTPQDYRNANLAILLAYIIFGHEEWRGAEIKIFAAFTAGMLDDGVRQLSALVSRGRLPISLKNIVGVTMNDESEFEQLVDANSVTADLVIAGLSLDELQTGQGACLDRFAGIEDILFVWTGQPVLIAEEK